MALPEEIDIRYCSSDNFLFVAAGSSDAYDAYYRSLANDSYHAELSPDQLHSPISQLQARHLRKTLGGFFDQRREVLDFGCGEASLLVELAKEFPSSVFTGFDPSPGAQVGARKAEVLGLKNLQICRFSDIATSQPYDLIIASHVLEHLIDFGILDPLHAALTDTGLLYLEVPDALHYEFYDRREFLYYFDRLHVNHFTPQSLARLASDHGFTYVDRLEYAFPYRDGGQYPALGMLFRKGEKGAELSSPNLREAAEGYIASEKQRSKAIAAEFGEYHNVLVWGAGDNFYRAMSNDGPLSELRNIVVLDRRTQDIAIGNRRFTAQTPADGIRQHPWPVIITISENRKSLGDLALEIDPNRRIYFV